MKVGTILSQASASASLKAKRAEQQCHQEKETNYQSYFEYQLMMQFRRNSRTRRAVTSHDQTNYFLNQSTIAVAAKNKLSQLSSSNEQLQQIQTDWTSDARPFRVKQLQKLSLQIPPSHETNFPNIGLRNLKLRFAPRRQKSISTNNEFKPKLHAKSQLVTEQFLQVLRQTKSIKTPEECHVPKDIFLGTTIRRRMQFGFRGVVYRHRESESAILPKSKHHGMSSCFSIYGESV